MTNMIKFNDGAILKIYHDEHCENSLSWDNNGIMVCFHKRYKLGDKHDYNSTNFNGWDELYKQIEQDNDDLVAILPLYLYDHSGISISVSPFSCRWDSGQVGFIYTTHSRLKKMGHTKDVNIDKVTDWLKSEVDTYNSFLIGDIYGFILHDKPCDTCYGEGEELNSCWGFIGNDPIENGMIDHLPEKYRRELKEVL